MAERIGGSVPLGLDGAVGMVRNWTFTLFFCMSELWGDVCLGLLFWGLANDTTSLADAPTLYPLFGLGANVAQALAGFALKVGRVGCVPCRNCAGIGVGPGPVADGPAGAMTSYRAAALQSCLRRLPSQACTRGTTWVHIHMHACMAGASRLERQRR